MTVTYNTIATTTLTSTATDITFSSIPSTYTDLVLIVNGGSSTANDLALYGQLNGDTGSNYSSILLNSAAANTVTSSRATNNTFMYLAALVASSQAPGVIRMNFLNYSNTTTNKTMMSRDDNAGYNVRFYTSLWRSTAAINSIKLYTSSDSFRSGTTASLYGIKAE